MQSRHQYTCISDEYWALSLRADLPNADALQRFAFARNRIAPMTSNRRPLAGGPGLHHRTRPGSPDQRPCHFGVGFPSSGPRTWTFTSRLLAMPFALAQSRYARLSYAPPPPPKSPPQPHASSLPCPWLLSTPYSNFTYVECPNHIGIARRSRNQRSAARYQLSAISFQLSNKRSQHTLHFDCGFF